MASPEAGPSNPRPRALVPGPSTARPSAALPRKKEEPSQTLLYFVAGGAAGAVSRTVVAPLERVKILYQVQSSSASGGRAYHGVWPSLVKIWREEGITGMFKGNAVNCVRIVPYSAVQFTAYEKTKRLMTGNGKRPLDTPLRLASGAIAGICSVCSTYPLDLVRSRLSIATATIGKTRNAIYAPQDLSIIGMTRKVMREEGGVRALYRGMVPTSLGVAPYVGINFAAYEFLRQYFSPVGEQPSTLRKLACGALAGSVSQTLTYPIDVLRRKMQVIGVRALGAEYNTAFGALSYIWRTEGIPGLYRGIGANLLKVAPAIVRARSFVPVTDISRAAASSSVRHRPAVTH